MYEGIKSPQQEEQEAQRAKRLSYYYSQASHPHKNIPKSLKNCTAFSMQTLLDDSRFPIKKNK